MITNNLRNAILVVGVFVVVSAVAVFRQKTPAAPARNFAEANSTQPALLPRMIDLGADKCIPCKKMAPILAELKNEYTGKAKIEFIDVWKNPGAGEPYGVRVIPTQIFFDRDGKEIWRHEGFLAKAEIVAKLKDLGAG
jgi:thioredoxin 1